MALDHYANSLDAEIPLVVNGPPDSVDMLSRIEGAHVHLPGWTV